MEEETQKNKLYVGNLPYSVDSDKLGEMFSELEDVEVEEAVVISDRESGRSKGFGFVTCKDEKMAEKAVKEMDGKEIVGKDGDEPRALRVNVARPKREKPAYDN